MIGTKTRIWRGGMSEILRPSSEVQADTGPVPGAGPAPAVAPPSELPAPTAHVPAVQTQVSSARKTRVGSGTLVGHVFDLSLLSDDKSGEPARRKASPMATTRLVPIEELLAGRVHPEPRPAEASASHPRASDGVSRDFAVEQSLGLRQRRLTGEHLRRGLIAVLLPLTIWVFLNRQGGDAPVATVPVQAMTPPVVGAAASAARAQPREESTPVAAPSMPVTAAVPSARQRAAVDALVAGDLTSARRIYGELASSTDVGDPRVFAEAARILDERMRASKN
ncbi:MAG: hypothetical protein RLZZ450_2693 [Pseudomonadota bacterium]|jgi:hypothetical protein